MPTPLLARRREAVNPAAELMHFAAQDPRIAKTVREQSCTFNPPEHAEG
jgi:hypothetical protein